VEILQLRVEISTYNTSTKRSLYLAPFDKISKSGGGGDGGGSIATLEDERLSQPSPLSTTYVAFDFEWSSSSANTNTQIIAAAF
jgi:hypothetical protein